MNNSSFPKISIVTPNLNGGEFLEKTILSVIGQNYPNLEYIIIDGGSSDNSIEIINKYKNYLYYYISESDTGIYDAIQKGFDISTGEIMAWLNSDDMYHMNSLFWVSDIFENDKVNWVTGFPTHFDKFGRSSINMKIPRTWYSYRFFCGDIGTIQQESVFWRRSLWEKAGSKINCGYKFAGDLNLWANFFLYDKLYTTNILLSGFRYTLAEDQKSFKFKNVYNKESKAIINAYRKRSKVPFLHYPFFILIYLFRILNRFDLLNVSNLEFWVLKKIFNLPSLIIFDNFKGKITFK